MNQLSHLQQLHLDGCYKLEEIPELPMSLKELEFSPHLLWTVPDLSYLTTLVNLYIQDADEDENSQSSFLEMEWIEGLSNPERLKVVMRDVTFPPINLATLSRLRVLKITCVDLMGLPSSLEELSLFDVKWPMERSLFSNLTNLSRLELAYCRLREAEYDDVLGHKPHSLVVRDSESLERLSVSTLKGLQSLTVSTCPRLREIQGVEKLGSLETLCILECSSLERLPDLSGLKKLRQLVLSFWPSQNLSDLRLQDTCYLLVEGDDSYRCFEGNYKAWKDTYGHSGDAINSQL